MLWAACCIGFFGFMRCGEFMLPDPTPFDAGKHLTAADIAVDSHHDPTMVSVRITQGHGNPLLGMLKLDLVLKGIHRIKPNQSQARLPVTPSIMAKIKGILDRSLQTG